MNEDSLNWKIKIEDGERDKTAFTPHCKLHRLINIPFGPHNNSENFWQTMYLIMLTTQW